MIQPWETTDLVGALHCPYKDARIRRVNTQRLVQKGAEIFNCFFILSCHVLLQYIAMLRDKNESGASATDVRSAHLEFAARVNFIPLLLHISSPAHPRGQNYPDAQITLANAHLSFDRFKLSDREIAEG